MGFGRSLVNEKGIPCKEIYLRVMAKNGKRKTMHVLHEGYILRNQRVTPPR